MSPMNDDQDKLGLADHRPHKIRRIEAPSTTDLACPSSDLDIGQVRTTAGEPQPPRTRGTVACQRCRSRKTKCDNRRPSCGYCLKVGEPCVYETESNSCCHVFGREVLQALNELREIVTKPPTARSLADGNKPSPTADIIHSAPHGTALARSPANGPFEAKSQPAVSLDRIQRVENIVQWRIFQPHLVASDIYPDANPPAPLGHSMPSTNITLLTGLEWRYTHSVHLLNPILDLPTLHDLILQVAESGFDWSLESCLAALVCAIGAITESLDVSDPHGALCDSDPDLAAGYWNIASKRLGFALDRNDITAVQCLCLAGVWHMHNLQPLQAWKYFSHAASAWFCTVMRNKPLRESLDRKITGSINVREALGFTIWKSTCELRPELSLPPSVLDDYELLRPFPSPPDFEDTTSIDSESGWYYYLAEIAARHIINDLLGCHVYDFDNIQPVDIARIIHQTNLFEAQINEWRSSLPPRLQFDIPADWNLPEVNDLMTVVLRQRYLSSLELTYRPLLRICTDFALQYSDPHSGIDSGLDTLRTKAAELASKNLHLSYLKIQGISRRLHHGTWFHLRSLTGSCLRFAAAEKAQRDRRLAGAQELQIPPGWRARVVDGLDILQPYWTSNRGGGAGLLALIEQALKL